MNGKRFHFLMIGLTCLLGLAVVAAAFGASSLLKSQAAKLNRAKLQNVVLSQQVISLAKAKKDVDKYSELNREARIIVPQDKNQAEVVREITNIGNRSGIVIDSISFPTSSLGSKAAASTGTDSSTTGGSASSSTVLSQTQPVKGLTGVYTMPITVTVQGVPATYNNFLSFLSSLEQNRRTAQVNTLSITPLNSGSKVTFTLTLNAYLKP